MQRNIYHGEFLPAAEGVKRLAARTGGKILLLSDGKSYPALVPFTGERYLSVVMDGEDALPLFAMPDGVGAIFAAGGSTAMRAARLFAQVRRIPCVLSPSESAQDGVFEERGEVCTGGKLVFPLSPAEVCYDEALLRPSLAEGYARLLLSRLALLEGRARQLLLREEAPREEAFALLTCLEGMDAEKIVRTNAALRQLEERPWEGSALAKLYGENGTFCAYCELLALYTAFFRRGKPRRYAVPDYAARAKRAGVPMGDIALPSKESYASAALALERRRGQLIREAELLTRRDGAYRREYHVRGGRDRKGESMLSLLPEHFPGGLSCMIRDFGLMEGI